MSNSRSIVRFIIIAAAALVLIPVMGNKSVYAAPDFTSGYVKESPNTHHYYNGLNGKTIIFNNYDSSAQLYEGEPEPYNFYELGYWNPDTDGFDLYAESSNPSVADVDTMCELYGSAEEDNGYYTAVITAKKKGTTTITVREVTENEPELEYDEYGNENYVYVEPTAKIYKFTVVITDKWYSGRLHKYTKISHSNVYRSTKKVKITLKNVYKGDKVTIKVGKNKKITKRIKKDKKSITYTIKFKKQPVGRKVAINVYDKYGKKVKSSSKPVYYASKIRKGMTKKQVKLLPGWGSPQNTETYGKYSTWWYKDYSKHVYFKNGRVTGWGR